MSKLTLATRLADELGVSIQNASQFVDDVGAPTARRALDEAVAAGSRTVSDWWKPVTAGGVLVGGGALAWRQQDLEQARAIAAQQQDYSSALASIMESDLSPEAKRELVVNLSERASGDATKSKPGLLGSDIQTTLILLVVLVFVLKFGLEEVGE